MRAFGDAYAESASLGVINLTLDLSDSHSAACKLKRQLLRTD